MGDGKNIRFWCDPWIGSKPLNIKFPRVFATCSNKTDMIVDVGFIVHGRWVWDLAFRRTFFDWEVPIYNDFLNTINARFPSSGASDSLMWGLNNTGIFSVKSLYQWAEKKAFDATNPETPAKINKAVPPKVNLLFWHACNNKIATKDNLLKRAINLVDNGLCALC